VKSEARLAPVFSKILYSQAWEDPVVDVEAFGGIGPEDDVFAIGASGDQTLLFATYGPRSITALDFNLTQCVMLELKVRAIERLTWFETLEFLGARPCGARERYYRRLRDALSEKAREFWDGEPETIRRGVIHSGRFENMFRIFRWTLLPLVQSGDTVRRLLRASSLEEQRRIYRERWDNWRWRSLFGVFFNKRVMAALGRSEAHFKYVTLESIKEQLLRRVRHVMTEVPVRGNYFVEYILTGEYQDPAGFPEYLREENHAKLRAAADRITIVNDELEHFVQSQADGAFSKFYLSDIFEYMSEAATEQLLRELWRAGRDGAVLSYRNLFAPRSRPESMKEMLEADPDLARRCNLHDRSFFYETHHVERVRRAGAPAAPVAAAPAPASAAASPGPNGKKPG
jgi:S-adenosylmethionine-diacylglycerol 3-amino-3-carboxypropyl transferase